MLTFFGILLGLGSGIWCGMHGPTEKKFVSPTRLAQLSVMTVSSFLMGWVNTNHHHNLTAVFAFLAFAALGLVFIAWLDASRLKRPLSTVTFDHRKGERITRPAQLLPAHRRQDYGV